MEIKFQASNLICYRIFTFLCATFFVLQCQCIVVPMYGLAVRVLGTYPGACIIKLITAIIYGFRNKLECSTQNKNTTLGWKGM